MGVNLVGGLVRELYGQSMLLMLISTQVKALLVVGDPVGGSLDCLRYGCKLQHCNLPFSVLSAGQDALGVP